MIGEKMAYHKEYKKLYRYEEIIYHPDLDENGNPIIGKIEIVEKEFDIVKHTPKGAWIKFGYNRKFVNLYARKKYACLTKEEALLSFIRRKQKSIEIFRYKKRVAEQVLRKGKLMAEMLYGWKVERYIMRNINTNEVISFPS